MSLFDLLPNKINKKFMNQQTCDFCDKEVTHPVYYNDQTFLDKNIQGGVFCSIQCSRNYIDSLLNF